MRACLRTPWTLALGLALLASFAVAAPGLAQQAQPQATSITLGQPRTTRTEGQLVLSATLTAQDGTPLSEQAVDFYQRVEFFGERDSHIGQATTDSTGLAVLLYEPAQVGQETILAHFAGDAEYAESGRSLEIQVQAARPAFEAHPLPLATIRDWFPIALGTIVLGTWAVLLGAFLSTVLGVRAAAAAEQPARQPAHAVVPLDRS